MPIVKVDRQIGTLTKIKEFMIGKPMKQLAEYLSNITF